MATLPIFLSLSLLNTQTPTRTHTHTRSRPHSGQSGASKGSSHGEPKGAHGTNVYVCVCSYANI